MQEKNNGYITVDLLQIVKSVINKLWLVILVGIVCAGIGFGYASYFIKPTYSSTVLLFANNSSLNVGSTTFKISASDLQASQGLVKTYTEILKTRTTLEQIIENSDVDYSCKQLSGMISAGDVNGTEIMGITVTCEDPYIAAKIANCIATVLPARVSEIIDGASMEIVDTAVPNLQKVAPSIARFTMLGFILGAFLIVGIIAVISVLDDTIYDENYVVETYNYPILAKVPNLMADGTRRYGSYGKKTP